MKFEWDSNKAKKNITAHDVTFEEASEVFDGIHSDYTNDYEDTRFEYSEDRYIAKGLTTQARCF